MKPIKLFLALICSIGLTAQTHSESIADVMVAGQKIPTITGLLGGEIALRATQGGLIKGLEESEEEYDQKRSFLSNAQNNALVIGAVQAQMFPLEKKIENIRSNIRVLKIASFGVGHGLSRYEAALETEEKYLQKIKEENTILASGVLISGGTGHVFTSFLKLLIRIMPIRNNILNIEKDINAKMTVTKIFAK